jgi:hypothetical protein
MFCRYFLAFRNSCRRRSWHAPSRVRADEDFVNSMGSRAMKNVRLSTQEHFGDGDSASRLSSSSLGVLVACVFFVAVVFVGVSRRHGLVYKISRMYGTM